MPLFRFPEVGARLLVFVRGHEKAKETENSIFPTYAHLMIFAVGVGYDRDERDSASSFLDKPAPIEQSVFENQGLIDVMRAIAVAVHGSHEILLPASAALFVRTIEELASGGMRVLSRELDDEEEPFYYRRLVEILETTVSPLSPSEVGESGT